MTQSIIMNDQVYIIIESTLTFQDNGVSLSPVPAADPGWTITSVPTFSDGSALDSDLITFDTDFELFSVYTD